MRIRMNHGSSNILDFELMDALDQALDGCAGIPVVVLSSSTKNFSMGVDIKIHTPELVPQMLDRFHNMIRKLYHFPGVTVAEVHGYALGGGMELALVCDFVVARGEAKVGFPEIKLACFPPVAAILLPRKMKQRSLELLFTGEMIAAKEALEAGLVDRNFGSDEKELFESFIGRVSCHSPDALRTMKKAIRETTGFDFDAELQKAEQIYLKDLMQSPDMAEGIRAFLEKRPPHWHAVHE